MLMRDVIILAIQTIPDYLLSCDEALLKETCFQLLKILKYYFIIIKHEINESNTKLSTHHWIIPLYSKNICCDTFTSHEFLTPKLSHYVTLLPFTDKAIQRVPIDLYCTRRDSSHKPILYMRCARFYNRYIFLE